MRGLSTEKRGKSMSDHLRRPISSDMRRTFRRMETIPESTCRSLVSFGKSGQSPPTSQQMILSCDTDGYGMNRNSRILCAPGQPECGLFVSNFGRIEQHSSGHLYRNFLATEALDRQKIKLVMLPCPCHSDLDNLPIHGGRYGMEAC